MGASSSVLDLGTDPTPDAAPYPMRGRRHHFSMEFGPDLRSNQGADLWSDLKLTGGCHLQVCLVCVGQGSTDHAADSISSIQGHRKNHRLCPMFSFLPCLFIFRFSFVNSWIVSSL